MHIIAFLRKANNKAMARPNHAHIYSSQRKISDFACWTKQVCLQTRLIWWQWWGIPDIIWNRVTDRRRSKRKLAITKFCLTVCRSIEKRHGVLAREVVAGVLWLFQQNVSDIWWRSTAVCSCSTNNVFCMCFFP